MKWLNLLKKRKKTKKKKTKRTINNIDIKELPEDIYGNLYPWANNSIDNTEITIGNIVMLWWLQKYNDTNRDIPKYFEKNYVISFDDEIKKLQNGLWINKDNSLTTKGEEILSNNFEIIEKHRQGWMIQTDLDSFKKARQEEMVEHNKYLRSMGLKELAEKNEKREKEQAKQYELLDKCNIAIQLSKEKRFEESNEILRYLIDSEFRQRAKIYERLAKNYRQQKEYQKEIDLCQKFLKVEQPKYGGFQWIDVFEKRIEFSEKKLIKLKIDI